MNRLYETTFVLKPTLTDEEADVLVSGMEQVVRDKGATVKTDRWGKRRLAYEIQHQKEGNYVLFTIDSPDGGVVHELERRLRIDDNVMRHLSVRVDLERRRAQKLSKLRGVPPPWERPIEIPPDPAIVTPPPMDDDLGDEEEV